MNKPLVIFGAGDIAELAHYYFTSDSAYDVAAFTVDAEYLTDSTLNDLPVVAYETLQASYPPADYDLFIALSYAKLNEVRKEKYLSAKAKGYHLASYVSSHATILNSGAIGDNCFILEDNTVQPFVKIGANVTLWSGNHIGHHSTIHDHCFIASHVVISGGVEIHESCFLGVNATLRDHITVGAQCVVGAGVLLLEDAAPQGVYRGPGAPRRERSAQKLKKI